MSKNVKDIFLSDWYYDDYFDNRTTHDSRIQHIIIEEIIIDKENRIRRMDIEICLINKRRNGNIFFKYIDVFSYSMIKEPRNHTVSGGHDDWLCDEIELSPNKNVTHQILLHNYARISIESKDIVFRFEPFQPSTPGDTDNYVAPPDGTAW